MSHFVFNQNNNPIFRNHNLLPFFRKLYHLFGRNTNTLFPFPDNSYLYFLSKTLTLCFSFSNVSWFPVLNENPSRCGHFKMTHIFEPRNNNPFFSFQNTYYFWVKTPILHFLMVVSTFTIQNLDPTFLTPTVLQSKAWSYSFPSKP